MSSEPAIDIQSVANTKKFSNKLLTLEESSSVEKFGFDALVSRVLSVLKTLESWSFKSSYICRGSLHKP